MIGINAMVIVLLLVVSLVVSGGIVAYSEDRMLTDEDRAVFDAALKLRRLMGVKYEPVSVATQVVAGMNYQFTAIATPVFPNIAPYPVRIFIVKSLQGEVALTGIIKWNEARSSYNNGSIPLLCPKGGHTAS
jgi:hypothetical protein